MLKSRNNLALLSEIGDINRFSNADKLAQFAGIAPLKLSSVGNTLPDIHREYGQTYEEYDDWLIKDIKGICFELADNDEDEEWDELKAPICAIYVYK